MSKSIFFSRTCLAGAVLAFSSMSANAGFVTAGYFGTQGAPSFPVNFPPLLGTGVSGAVNAFGNATTLLGTQSFESNASSFNYGNGGSASVSAGPTVINGNVLQDQTLGRYNMTTGLACPNPLPGGGCDQPDRGKWLESNVSFTYTLTQAVSAIAFFGTDFGDFDATVSLQLLLNGIAINGALFQIQTIPLSTGGMAPSSAINGNLIFFGAVGESDADIFNGFRFNIGQLASGQASDFIGIDSLILATSKVTAPPPPNPVPTPSSLALTGLALVLLARFHRRRS